jgi:hypothetical protein
MYALERSLTAALALPLLLSLSACGKTESDKPAEEVKPKVEKLEPAMLFVGDAVTLPPTYGALKLGMTQAEGKAAMADLPEDGTIKSEAYEGIWFNTDFDDDTTKLDRVYFNMPKADAVKAATEKWGPPQEGTDSLDAKLLYWFNPAENLRVSIGDSYTEGEAQIEFTHYWPVAQLIGEGKELAFEKDAPLLGLTPAELEAKYPKWIKKESEDDAKKSQEDIAKLAGEDVKALMGKPTASIDLEYPPTEWGSYWTPVHLSWTDEGKLERFWFGIDFDGHPAAKDEIFALFTKKWGEPKEEEEYGDKIFVFSENPRIEVEEDTISNKWDVSVELPETE